jgi:hypothetical protein
MRASIADASLLTFRVQGLWLRIDEMRASIAGASLFTFRVWWLLNVQISGHSVYGIAQVMVGTDPINGFLPYKWSLT